MSVKARLYALVWLHLVRTSRFTLSLVNWGVVEFLWLSIYILGVLSFADPSEYATIVPMVFWAVAAFGLMSTPVWTIGDWMKYYVNEGILEENELCNVSHTLFLALRALPSIVLTLASLGIAWLFLREVTGLNPARAEEPLFLLFGLSFILLQATLYSLIIAFLSLYTEAPGPLLDFMNLLLFVAGGVAAPIDRLPEPLKIVAVIAPYSHPAEVMRYGSVGYAPYLGLTAEIIVTIAYTSLLALTVAAVSRASLRKARVEGVKGIGRT
ncbi:MAG: ABC transporter permease [Desulfurococcales archaeon]|nr:ABC transporter permease [Desulfurococcales archaeon]